MESVIAVLQAVIDLETNDFDYEEIEQRMRNYPDGDVMPRAMNDTDTLVGPMPELARKMQAFGWTMFEENAKKYGELITRESPLWADATRDRDHMALVGHIMWDVITEHYNAKGKDLAIVEGYQIVEEIPYNPMKELMVKLGNMGMVMPAPGM